MALAAVISAGLAARDSLVFVSAGRYPSLAAKLAPANAKAIVRVFDKTVLTSDNLRRDYKGWISASKQALRSDPLNAAGVRLLAYVTELTPNGQSHARRLMQLSEQTSRRDLFAQIWLIEDAVRRNDVASALKHYDRALSVRPASQGQLVPILVAAASEPDIRTAMVPYLRANRSWVVPFLSVAIAKGQDPMVIVDLFGRYGGARAVPAHAELEEMLLRRLVREGSMREARTFAATIGAGREINDFGFSPSTVDARFRPLTWNLYEGADGDVALDERRVLSIDVRPETRIVAASRTIPASAGRLILKQRVSYSDTASAPLVTWKAYCRHESGAPTRFWTRDLPVMSTPTTIEAPIEVPGGCTGVQIDLEATGTGGAVESKVMIDDVALTAS